MRSRAAAGLLALAMIGTVVAAGTSPATARTARTYRVQIDATPPVGQPWSFERFFPGPTLKVHRGDTLDFAWNGTDTPHTATLIPSSHPNAWRRVNQGPGGAFESPIPDATLGGDDGELIENPSEVFPTDPTCGTSSDPCSFDGSSVVNAGLLLSNPAAQPSFHVTIGAPVGTYSFLCLLHPGMQVRLKVEPRATSIPGPVAVAQRVSDQVRQATKVDGAIADQQAQNVTTVPLTGGATRFVLSAGGFSNGVTANEYPDDPVHVHVGDRIQFRGTGEIHTATFPKGAASRVPFVKTQCEVPGPDIPAASPLDCANPGQFEVALNAKALLPTGRIGLRDPHRFVNSGLLSGGVQHTFLAREPGTYTFVCLVHGPEMQSTIIVS